jgi:type IV secretory pathway VirB6-like protein
VPKNEHPSTYEDLMPPYSYQAQDSTPYLSQQKNSTYRAYTRQQRSHWDSDGDAFEHGYRPYSAYNMQWQVPVWARPQHNSKHTLRTAIFLVLGVLLIVPILKVMVFLLAGIAVLFGVALFAIILLGIALAFLVVFVSIAFLLFAALGGGRVRPWRRPNFRPWQRSPWGW